MPSPKLPCITHFPHRSSLSRGTQYFWMTLCSLKLNTRQMRIACSQIALAVSSDGTWVAVIAVGLVI